MSGSAGRTSEGISDMQQAFKEYVVALFWSLPLPTEMSLLMELWKESDGLLHHDEIDAKAARAYAGIRAGRQAGRQATAVILIGRQRVTLTEGKQNVRATGGWSEVQ